MVVRGRGDGIRLVGFWWGWVKGVVIGFLFVFGRGVLFFVGLFVEYSLRGSG